jgi:hypothetical protein
MSGAIVAAVTTFFGGIAVAASSYLFTKRHEREAALRREKLEHYKEFVASLSGIVSGEGTDDNQRAFALACNKLMLVAPQAVIAALRKFQDEIKLSNSDKSVRKHDLLMSRLFYEMRRDLNMSPADDADTFEIGLWASGVAPKGSAS